jgi:fumarylacetoacetate (FAA) hydrolase family protein
MTMLTLDLDLDSTLPTDGTAGTLIGRAWVPDAGGPSPVALVGDQVIDVSGAFATVSDLGEQADPATALSEVTGVSIGSIAEVIANTPPATRDSSRPWLLSPVDLQTLKASGVTFAVSMIERVIEERVRGNMEAAASMREEILTEIGADLTRVKPNTVEAEALKKYLVARDLWSQYLEVGLGPDAEIFTKGPTMSSMGTGVPVGYLSASAWNNPEPEAVIAVASTGRIWGGMLGNDVNLRDIEGRSALLLGRAKDNNASCALGPFIRVFDSTFSLEDMRTLSISLEIDGEDGFHLEGSSEMSQISRDPEDLVAQLLGEHHQYPDGAVLMLGTMFAPVTDRDVVGSGFTHHRGDVVRISAGQLGSLVNHVEESERCEPWEFGIVSLMRNLAGRNLL